MKKLTICIAFLFLGITALAQETKKYLVFQTNSYAVKKFENGKDVWKPEVPYKDYVRIVFAPFDMPEKANSLMTQELTNQVAEFIYKTHLKEFEKLKLHGGFSFEVRDYILKDYDRDIKDCTNCSYQHKISVINGFSFIPKEAKGYSEYYRKMREFLKH